MKKLNLLITALFFIIVSVSTTASNPNNDLIGEWKFDVTQAPYEFQKGKLVIEQAEDQLEGKVVFERSRDVSIRGIGIEEEEITFTFYVQGEKVQVIGNIEENKFVGYAETSQDKMNFLAEKVTGQD
ncbi:MAG: hypothetical protein V5A59_12890 [Bacteroidales bacterium]|nr:hypothetical protein [Bacteroidales bacterium]